MYTGLILCLSLMQSPAVADVLETVNHPSALSVAVYPRKDCLTVMVGTGLVAIDTTLDKEVQAALASLNRSSVIASDARASRLAVGTTSGRLTIYGPSFRFRFEQFISRNSITALGFSPDSKLLGVASGHSIYIIDMAKNKVASEFEIWDLTFDARVHSLLINSDGSCLVSGGVANGKQTVGFLRSYSRVGKLVHALKFDTPLYSFAKSGSNILLGGAQLSLRRATDLKPIRTVTLDKRLKGYAVRCTAIKGGFAVTHGTGATLFAADLLHRQSIGFANDFKPFSVDFPAAVVDGDTLFLNGTRVFTVTNLSRIVDAWKSKD